MPAKKRSLDLARQHDLDSLAIVEAKLLEAAADGHLRSIDLLLKLQARRAKLIGLDSPKRVEKTKSQTPLVDLTEFRDSLNDAIAEADHSRNSGWRGQ